MTLNNFILLKSAMDACDSHSFSQAWSDMYPVFIIFGIGIATAVVSDYYTRKTTRLNPSVKVQEQKALELAHEFEETIHECCQTPLFDFRYLDPVINAFTVGRVSRTQLHEAIGHWMKDGTDFRIEENRFWKNS